MSDAKMLQAILDKVSSVDRKVDKGFKDVNKRVDGLDNKLTARIDKIGLSVARLEDDTPTIDEFNKLVRKVSKLENRVLEN